MAQHRAEETYIPIKTITAVAWFFGLLFALTFGLTIGDKFSVYSHPMFGPFPTAQALVQWAAIVPPTVEPTQEIVPTEAPRVEEAAAVISMSEEVATVARQPAVRTSEPVRTPDRVIPSAVPTSAPVADQPVISTPDPVVETPVLTTPPTVTEEPEVEEPIVTDIPTPTGTEETPTPEATATPTESE